ncbi:response regulator [Ferrimonas balearica]|uniref:response regulator n=1 Tax=Ferrimonas balearica TaxID=44012 RepID=UPI001C99EBCC|nr:response regulator [Ferrimonas balearica]MBY5992435.1 winged helix-turn-helix domain-containing protein [Ferrimonas balearica]
MRYQIDDFILDVRHHSLYRGQTLLSSDERLIRLLQLLIERAPEHLDQATLLAALWPDTRVSNWSISRLISDARKLFNDAGADFPVIQTVHGRGYRLASEAQARQVPLPESPSAPEPMPAPEQPSAPRRPLWAAAIALQLVVLVLLGWLILERSEAPLKIGEIHNPVARVLWVDDHPENNAEERHRLQQQSVAVYTTTSSHEAKMLLAMYQYDVIISDMGRAGDPLAGLKLVETLRQQGNDTPYLMYTILPSEAQRRLVLEHGAQGVAVDADNLFQMLSQYMPVTL